jgi:hypothetical protein
VTIDPTMPPRNTIPRATAPTAEQAAPKERTSRYVVEIREASGASLLLTSADWTAKERDLAISAVLRLVGFKPAAPATRKASKARGDEAPSAKASRKN